MSSPKSFFLKLIALLVCIVPTVIATLSYFPVWKSRSSGALLSGFTVLILLICFSPLLKAVKRFLISPSVFTVWLVLFVTLVLIRSIAYEMTVISFVGMISNLFGSLLFKLSRRVQSE